MLFSSFRFCLVDWKSFFVFETHIETLCQKRWHIEQQQHSWNFVTRPLTMTTTTTTATEKEKSIRRSRVVSVAIVASQNGLGQNDKTRKSEAQLNLMSSSFGSMHNFHTQFTLRCCDVRAKNEPNLFQSKITTTKPTRNNTRKRRGKKSKIYPPLDTHIVDRMLPCYCVRFSSEPKRIIHARRTRAAKRNGMKIFRNEKGIVCRLVDDGWTKTTSSFRLNEIFSFLVESSGWRKCFEANHISIGRSLLSNVHVYVWTSRSTRMLYKHMANNN